MNDDSHLGRTSLWSVPERWSAAYLWLFASQSLIWLVLLILNATTTAESVNIVSQAVDVGIAWAPLLVVSAGVSMLIVEVPMVFADKYLNYRYKLGREEGLERGREQGLEEGIELGSRRERARWERYVHELEEARMTGKPDPERPRAHNNGSANR